MLVVKSQKPKIIKVLQIIHLVVFVTSIIIISLLHVFTQNFLDFLRMPVYVKAIDPWTSSNWPGTFHFYHVVLVFYLLLTFINGLGLFLYSTRIWRIISDTSSFLSFLVIWPTSLFFVYTLASSGPLNRITVQSALFFFIVTFSLFILDLITWYVDEQSLIKFGKEQMIKQS